MTLSAPIDLKQWFIGSVESFLCLQPTSISAQPAHVLNGFFNSLLSGTRRPGHVASLVAPKSGLWAEPADAVRKKLRHVSLPASDRDLDRVRHAFAGLLAADRAVFRTDHSFQIAHLGLVSSDRTHMRIGELGARLVMRSPTSRKALEDLVARLRTEQANPHWYLQELLSEPELTAGWQVEEPQAITWWAGDPSARQYADELSAFLGRVISVAATAEDVLLPLQVLAVAVSWVGLLVYAQVPNLLLGRGLAQLLVEAGPPGANEVVRDVSAEHVRSIHGAFDAWTAMVLEESLGSEFGLTELTDAQALAVLKSGWKPYSMSGGRGSADVQGKVPGVFKAWNASEGTSARTALAHTLTDALRAGMGDKPKKWFEAVGRHCGFVGPRRGSMARLRCEVALLPALVIAGLSDADPDSVDLREVHRRLNQRFGLTLGPGMAVRGVSEVDLDANFESLKDGLLALGLAHRYSDGVTEVLNPLTRWSK